MRALASSTDQVLALAANFSKEADSYLVCIQNDEGNYETQAINIHNKPRQGRCCKCDLIVVIVVTLMS